MPRFYFDIRDNSGLRRDEIGEDFADFEEAREQAQCLLPDIARDELPDGELHSVSCEVRNEAERVVYKGTLTYEGERVPKPMT